MGRVYSGGGDAGRGWSAGAVGLSRRHSRRPRLLIFLFLFGLCFDSCTLSPSDCLNSRPFPQPALPVSGTSPAPVPTGRCRLLSGTRTARAGNKSGFHDSLPSSNAPNLSPPGSPLGARGAGRAVPAVKAAAGAPAGRGAGGGVWPGWGEGSVARAGRTGGGGREACGTVYGAGEARWRRVVGT